MCGECEPQDQLAAKLGCGCLCGGVGVADPVSVHQALADKHSANSVLLI